MNRDETKKLLMRIQTAYPNWKPQADLKYVIDVWNEYLSEYSYEQALMGLKAFILSNTGGFAPSIGQLIDKMHIEDSYSEMGEMEAWALVRKAISRGNYYAKEDFDNFPPLIQKAVASPGNLRNWSQSDIESVDTVIQSNFLRTYRTVVAQEREKKKLSPDILELINAAQTRQIEQNTVKAIADEKSADRDTQAYTAMPKNISERIAEIFGGDW